MISFREWIKLQSEGSVPDVVDLTKPVDQGTTYWGAVPKTGSETPDGWKKKSKEILSGFTRPIVQRGSKRPQPPQISS